MGITFIYAEIMGDIDFHRLAMPPEAKGKRPPGDGREVANELVAVAQLLWIGWNAMVFQVARRRAGHHFGVTNMASDKGRIVQRAAADHAVYVTADQIHRTIGHAKIDADIRIAPHKIRQQGDEHVPGGGAAHVNPQMPFGRRAGNAKRGVDVFDIYQDPERFFIVFHPFRRRDHPASRPVQEAYLQVRLKRFHQLAQRGDGHVQRVRRAGKAAGFHHPGKGAHRHELIHETPSDYFCM